MSLNVCVFYLFFFTKILVIQQLILNLVEVALRVFYLFYSNILLSSGILASKIWEMINMQF